jgi:hypothetical protein
MSYMDDLERDLVGVLENAPDQKMVVNYVKNKLLESYRNGLTAGKKGFPDKMSAGYYGARAPRPRRAR